MLLALYSVVITYLVCSIMAIGNRYTIAEADNTRAKRKVDGGHLRSNRNFDSKNVIEYIIKPKSETEPFKKRYAVRRVIEQLEHDTCLQFKEAKDLASAKGTSRNRVLVFRDDLSGSYTAWPSRKYPNNYTFYQTLIVNRFADPVANHELGHAFSFDHEQQRRDSDLYLKYKGKSPSKNTLPFGTCYDFGSNMHGGKNPAYDHRKGYELYEYTGGAAQYKRSFIDTLTLNRVYCWDKCKGTKNPCLNGGYMDPDDCSKCKCPFGLAGDTCTEPDNILCPDVGVLKAKLAWGVITREMSGPNGANCSMLIKAPPGKRVEAQVIFHNPCGRKNQNDYCKTNTFRSYIEVKTGSHCLSNKTDFATTGFRLCVCRKEPYPTLVSESNLMVIIAHKYKKWSHSCCDSFKYKVEYRYVEAGYVPPTINLVPNGDHDGIWDWEKKN